MSFINKLKEQPKTLLATVAISAATLGFAGGMGISKISSSATQASLPQSQFVPDGQAGSTKGMPPGRDSNTQGMPPGQAGNTQSMPPGQAGQGVTPPDTSSGASQSAPSTNSNSSSDEVNDLKQRNQEIKAQIAGEETTSGQ